MKEVKFITCCPDDTYYTWQVHLWLESLKDLGKSDKAIVLIFIPRMREKNTKWEEVTKLYPEAEFNFISDTPEDDLNKLISIYIPIIRPYMMWKYLKENPQLSNQALFYCDSDILFTRDFSIDKFLNDDIHYLSDTNSYINASYFDSKINQVLPEKLDDYKNRDILGELASLVGISREVAEANNENSGGAQYLLKNTDYKFWSKVMNDSILIRTYLQQVNRFYFKTENEGFQSWCADMWAVLWNLWLRDQETRVVPELEFAWATEPIGVLNVKSIFHNAGITGVEMGGHPCFYKGKYHRGEDPTKDPFLDEILNNEESQKYCTWYYANKLKELHEKYKINY